MLLESALAQAQLHVHIQPTRPSTTATHLQEHPHLLHSPVLTRSSSRDVRHQREGDYHASSALVRRAVIIFLRLLAHCQRSLNCYGYRSSTVLSFQLNNRTRKSHCSGLETNFVFAPQENGVCQTEIGLIIRKGISMAIVPKQSFVG